MGRLGRAFTRCGHLLAWVVTLGVATLVTVAVVVPRLGGGTPYAVLTGSMRPGMPPGTMVVVRPTPAEDIRIGDVVTYQLRSGEAGVVTHRVVGIGVDGAGERVFRTQGDANDAPDAAWVRPVQVKGVRWYAVPQLGRMTNVLDGAERQAVLTLLVGALSAYAAYALGSEQRERRRRRAVGAPAIAGLSGRPGVSHG